jgi:hypothetical protein
LKSSFHSAAGANRASSRRRRSNEHGRFIEQTDRDQAFRRRSKATAPKPKAPSAMLDGSGTGVTADTAEIPSISA